MNLKPITPEMERLNLLYKHLKPGAQKSLENYNGKRKLYVVRGYDYLNKVVWKETNPQMIFVNTFMNLGSISNPRLESRGLALRVPSRGDIQIRKTEYFGEKGIMLDAQLVTAPESYRKFFKSFEDLRRDDYFMHLVSLFFGKDYELPGPSKNYMKFSDIIKYHKEEWDKWGVFMSYPIPAPKVK